MTLPVEIYSLIIEHVAEQRDLCSLARCSTILQLEAEPSLYRYITVEIPGDFLKPIQSIISHRRRHHLVQVLEIRSAVSDWSSTDLSGRSAIARLIARLLRVTMHLKALKVCDLPEWIFHRANYPLLKSFHFQAQAPSLRWADLALLQHEHQFVIKFFERHSSVTKLSLTGVSLIENPHVVQLPLLPFLHTLNIFQGEFPSWIEDRPLKAFFLSSWVPVIQILPTILHMASTLMALDITGCRGEGIEKIASSLPLLRYLGLPALRFSSAEFYHSWKDHFVRSVQTYLPMLAVVKLGFTTVGPSIPSDLLAIQESLKWVISTKMPSTLMVHTRDNPSKPVVEDLELQHVLLDLGIKVIPSGLQLVCFPAKDDS